MTLGLGKTDHFIKKQREWKDSKYIEIISPHDIGVRQDRSFYQEAKRMEGQQIHTIQNSRRVTESRIEDEKTRRQEHRLNPLMNERRYFEGVSKEITGMQEQHQYMKRRERKNSEPLLKEKNRRQERQLHAIRNYRRDTKNRQIEDIRNSQEGQSYKEEITNIPRESNDQKHIQSAQRLFNQEKRKLQQETSKKGSRREAETLLIEDKRRKQEQTVNKIRHIKTNPNLKLIKEQKMGRITHHTDNMKNRREAERRQSEEMRMVKNELINIERRSSRETRRRQEDTNIRNDKRGIKLNQERRVKYVRRESINKITQEDLDITSLVRRSSEGQMKTQTKMNIEVSSIFSIIYNKYTDIFQWLHIDNFTNPMISSNSLFKIASLVITTGCLAKDVRAGMKI